MKLLKEGRKLAQLCRTYFTYYIFSYFIDPKYPSKNIFHTEIHIRASGEKSYSQYPISLKINKKIFNKSLMTQKVYKIGRETLVSLRSWGVQGGVQGSLR